MSAAARTTRDEDAAAVPQCHAPAKRIFLIYNMSSFTKRISAPFYRLLFTREIACVRATTPGCEREALLGSESIRVPRSPRVLSSSCAAPPRPQTWTLDAVTNRQAKLAERNKETHDHVTRPCHNTCAGCKSVYLNSTLSLTHTHARARACPLFLCPLCIPSL